MSDLSPLCLPAGRPPPSDLSIHAPVLVVFFKGEYCSARSTRLQAVAASDASDSPMALFHLSMIA
jgi:hypothetical protein